MIAQPEICNEWKIVTCRTHKEIPIKKRKMTKKIPIGQKEENTLIFFLQKKRWEKQKLTTHRAPLRNITNLLYLSKLRNKNYFTSTKLSISSK